MASDTQDNDKKPAGKDATPAATQATVPTGDTPQVVSDPLSLKVYEGKRATAEDNHVSGTFGNFSNFGMFELARARAAATQKANVEEATAERANMERVKSYS